MNETIWQPSRLHPGRVHAQRTAALALCGAELDPTAVRCALCAIEAAGSSPHTATDVRSHIEADCAGCAEPHQELLLALREADLDDDPNAQYSATRATLAVERAIAAAYADTEQLLSTLDAAPRSHRARDARAHLLETLVALNESLTSHDHVVRSLRSSRA